MDVVASVKEALDTEVLTSRLDWQEHHLASGEVEVAGQRVVQDVFIDVMYEESLEPDARLEVRNAVAVQQNDHRLMGWPRQTRIPETEANVSVADLNRFLAANVWVFVSAVDAICDAIADKEIADTLSPRSSPALDRVRSTATLF